MGTLRQAATKGALWAFLEKIGMQMASFVVSLVLARLLTPNDYGTIALVTVFVSLAQVFADSGFGQALVQRKNPTDIDFNSVFYCGLAISGVVYGVLFFVAPYVADFYQTPVLKPILRVMSLGLLTHAINSIQNAEISRKMLFNLSFKISIISFVVSSSVGISMAYLGYGPWAIVISSMASSIVNVIAKWFIISWRPKLMFSFGSLRSLFAYGWKITASCMLDMAYGNLNALLIGKLYSKADLAFVNKGNSVPALANDAICNPLGRVAFPVFSSLQNDTVALRNALRRSIRFSMFFVLPLMFGIAVVAPTLVPLLFGDQWHGSVVYVQLACITFALYPLHGFNLQCILALGHSGTVFWLEVVKKIIGIGCLLLFYRQGVFLWMLMMAVMANPLMLIVNTFPMRKLIGYSLLDQLLDVLPVLFVSAVMAMFVFPLNMMPVCGGVRLITQAIVGIVVYLAIARFFKMSAMREFAAICEPVVEKYPKFVRIVYCKVFGGLA